MLKLPFNSHQIHLALSKCQMQWKENMWKMTTLAQCVRAHILCFFMSIFPLSWHNNNNKQLIKYPFQCVLPEKVDKLNCWYEEYSFYNQKHFYYNNSKQDWQQELPLSTFERLAFQNQLKLSLNETNVKMRKKEPLSKKWRKWTMYSMDTFRFAYQVYTHSIM